MYNTEELEKYFHKNLQLIEKKKSNLKIAFLLGCQSLRL